MKQITAPDAIAEIAELRLDLAARPLAIPWFAVAKSVFDHPVLSGEFDRRSAWLWLIANAAFKDHDVRTRAGVIVLKRGHVVIGSEHLAKVFGWSRKRVRNFVAELRQQGMLELGQRDGQYASVAKISNYERFQKVAAFVGPADGPTKGQRGANGGPHRTKDNKGNKDSPPTPKGATAEVREAFDAYNASAARLGLAKAEKLTADRARKIAARLADYGLDGWCKAIDNIERSPFLMGRTHHAFRVGLDFVCQPASFSKLHDGGYSSSNGVPALRLLDLGDGEQHISRYGRA